jgi:hypothetical protein
MPFHDDRKYMETLKWDDIFKSETEFISKVTSIGGITSTTDLTELYEILSMKYVSNQTRYTDEFAFIMALKRELRVEFPFYLKKKAIVDELMDLEISEIQVASRQLRNVVDQHDEPVTNASSVPIDDLSTQQENIRVTNNELEALRQKYSVMNRNYLQGIYKLCDPLFRVILAEDTKILYDQGEES